MFGSYDLRDFKNFNFLLKTCPAVLDNKQIDFKYTGHNKVNRFCRIEKSINDELELYLNQKHNTDYEWTFEYFHSASPVGLHTDYDKKTYSKKDENGIRYYEILAGFIAPIEWTCKQPYTLTYNKIQAVPRKLMYKQKQMRYLDNNEIVDYRQHGKITSNIEKYVSKNCDMYEQMQDIEISSVYEWQLGTYMLFDTKRWHSSSWYSSADTYKELKLTEYKRSIIGFATKGFKTSE